MARLEPYVKASEVVRRTPTLLDTNGTSNIGLVMVSAVGPRLAYIQGPNQFLATYTIGGEIPRNADISFINAYYLSFSAGLVIARSMNTTAVGGILFTDDSQIPVLYKDNQLLTKQTTIDFVTSEDTWSFVLNDTVFFNGNYADVSLDPDYESYQNFVQLDSLADLADSVSNWKETTATFATNTLTVKHGVYVEFITDEVGTANKGIAVTINDTTNLITVTEDKWQFSVYAKASQVSDIYDVDIDLITGEAKNFEFTVRYPGAEGTVTETYLVSLFTEANDPNGANSYIDNLNVMPNFNFGVEVFKSEVLPSATSNAIPFGASGLNLDACKKASNLKTAVTELEDQALYDIEYLAPVGITNLAFLKRYIQAGKANYWFTPVDVPKDRTNANSIDMYMREIDNNSNVYACGPFDKNSGLTGWINHIACSTLYYERIMNNKANGAEFAPVFDKEFGTVQMVNPTTMLGKTDREKLLNFGSPVNFVSFDQRLNLFYMNNNLTHQSVDDVMSEEQNRRLVNKIKKDLIRLMGQFKGKYNTNSTRESVISVITFYFQNNIMNKQFPPDAFNVICDDKLNTTELIRANKLAVKVQVRLYNSIKYIDVLNEIFPLGVDFAA